MLDRIIREHNIEKLSNAGKPCASPLASGASGCTAASCDLGKVIHKTYTN
jgi:hypothetical protein